MGGASEQGCDGVEAVTQRTERARQTFQHDAFDTPCIPRSNAAHDTPLRVTCDQKALDSEVGPGVQAAREFVRRKDATEGLGTRLLVQECAECVGIGSRRVRDPDRAGAPRGNTPRIDRYVTVAAPMSKSEPWPLACPE